MALVPEFKLFEVCLDLDKKMIMIKALDNYIDSLQDVQASRIKLRETYWLKEEIEKMKVCK